MPSVTVQVAADTDDCASRADGVGRAVSGESKPFMGYSGAQIWINAYRFPLDIPQGATITAASLEVKAAAGDTGAAGFQMSCEDVDHCGTFAYTTHDSLTMYANRVAHNPWWNVGADWTLNTWYASNTAVACVQDVINRAGWSPGNYIGMLVFGRTDYTNHRQFYHYADGAANAMKLNVTWQARKSIMRPGLGVW
jgi:hypothetical protein